VPSPQTAIYVSSYCYVCVLRLLYVCPHCYACVLILLCMCPQTAMYVSSDCYVCVLILLYVSSCCYICVLILLFLCPHTAIYLAAPYKHMHIPANPCRPLQVASGYDDHSGRPLAESECMRETWNVLFFVPAHSSSGSAAVFVLLY
jgi:hypothetical protein